MIVRNLIASMRWKVDDSDLKKSDKFVKDLLNWAKVAAVAAAGAAGAFAKSAIDSQLEFEKGLSRLQTLLPNQQGQVEQFAGDIRKLAVETGVSVGQLNDALYEQISALGATAESSEVLGMVAKSSIAAGTDAKTVVDLLSAVGLAYQDTSAKALAATNDMAFQAAALGKTTYAELSAGIGQVTGIATQLGVSQAEMFSIMGTASGVTGKTAQVFTQFQATMNGLLKPTTELKKVYKELGITAIEQEVAQNGLVPTLKRVMEATDGSLNSAGELFSSVEAMTLVLPLLNNLQTRQSETLMAMTKAQGSALQAQEASTGGMAKSAQKAKLLEAQFAELQLVVGEKLTPDFLDAQATMMGWATIIADTFLPMWDDMRETFALTGSDMDAFTASTDILRVSFAGVLEVVNGVVFGVRSVTLGIQMMYEALATKGMGSARLDQLQADSDRIEEQFKTSSKQVFELAVDPETMRNRYKMRQAEAKAQQARESTLNQTSNTYQMSNKVELVLPKGTTAEQGLAMATEAKDRLMREALDRAAWSRLSSRANASDF